MGFKFTFLCELLSDLEKNRIAKDAHEADRLDFVIIREWFKRYDCHVNHVDTNRLALLSCMFPEKRVDRVFWLQATSLSRVIGRCLGLGSSRSAELGRWRKSGGPDLGQCVEDVMSQTENEIAPGRDVTTEEIDMALGMIASRCRFSGPQVRRQHAAVDVERALSSLYRRLKSRDAKWLTRMILKSYAPVIIPPKYALERFHFLLPRLLQFQDTFQGALQMLDSKPMRNFPPHPDPKLAASLCAMALKHLEPRTGIKIGRPDYFKARSSKHCYSMANGRRMSVERKYDGEYCQIHIDLTNKSTPIQIFSKSGKDSTDDRSGIFPSLENALRIGSGHCRFSRRCILEGELVVWSEKRAEIADFHKLRKFLTRSGTMIGIDNDSPGPQPYEHLMIIFFDILVLDDDICLRKPHRERRIILKDVVETIHGQAALSEQEILDFGHLDSQHRLEISFAKAIAQRWEGYVLKACDEPYFPMYTAGMNSSFGRWIKLKKDYITGLGDTVDLSLVGAYYDARDAVSMPSLRGLKWTHFLVGCLLNKEAVLNNRETPHFRTIDTLHRHSMHRSLLKALNQHGLFFACDPDEFHAFRVQHGRNDLPQACVLFKKPFVVEVYGSGFEKPSGVRYYTLRFPRIRKIFPDRTFEDTPSFQELQLLAEYARSVPKEDLSNEVERWRKRLKIGSGANQYITPRSSNVPSTCSSEAGPEANSDSQESRASSHDRDESHISQPRSYRVDTQDSDKLSSSNGDESLSEPPVICIDTSDSNSSAANPICDSNILTENENLSRRKPSAQGRHNNNMQESEKTNAPTTGYGLDSNETADLVSSRSIRNGLAPSKQDTEPQGLSKPPGASGPSNHAEKGLKSPLTTIPVYKSGKPSDEDTAPGSSVSRLEEFTQALLSPETMISLEQSNPRAARQMIVFGIILVNPGKHPLGKEIQRTADALSKALFCERPHIAPSQGKIFFLDSVILQQDIQPEDIKFCLRETWSDLSRLYYYACLQWNSSESNEGNTAVGSSSDGRLPSTLSVTFDESEIQALGEYTSTELANQIR
ncbi:hypothetical protein VI817_003703 [Penicillium citrinum]|nr:hypothetical protein VI817_003703 [Penicillium citrinum]